MIQIESIEVTLGARLDQSDARRGTGWDFTLCGLMSFVLPQSWRFWPPASVAQAAAETAVGQLAAAVQPACQPAVARKAQPGEAREVTR